MPFDPKSFAQQAVAELQAPKTLTERNWVQLQLADRLVVCSRGELDTLDALCIVAPIYGERFPNA